MRVGGGEGNLRLVRRQGETAGEAVYCRARGGGRPPQGVQAGAWSWVAVAAGPEGGPPASEELRPAPIAARCLS